MSQPTTKGHTNQTSVLTLLSTIVELWTVRFQNKQDFIPEMFCVFTTVNVGFCVQSWEVVQDSLRMFAADTHPQNTFEAAEQIW